MHSQGMKGLFDYWAHSFDWTKQVRPATLPCPWHMHTSMVRPCFWTTVSRIQLLSGNTLLWQAAGLQLYRLSKDGSPPHTA